MYVLQQQYKVFNGNYMYRANKRTTSQEFDDAFPNIHLYSMYCCL